ncbi:MAG TPA: hypothetical protein EYP14_09035, partial [Planctomycetaceae bacterium]|nr:hypothetical protein [Planctomycetaceae bacterium]
NLTVIRPADANEVRVAWEAALENAAGPTALVFTRQRVPTLDRAALAPADELKKGGYVIWESGDPQVVLIGTGSEVHIALAAGKSLAEEEIGVRVVSLPSFELFERQPKEYRDSVLLPRVRARVAVEAGVSLGWERYVGEYGAIVGVDRFGRRTREGSGGGRLARAWRAGETWSVSTGHLRLAVCELAGSRPGRPGS